MIMKSPKPLNSPQSKHAARILGRSEATGKFILRPASKTGTISIAAARAAVKSVNSKKK